MYDCYRKTICKYENNHGKEKSKRIVRGLFPTFFFIKNKKKTKTELQNFVFREKVTMKKVEKTPETLRFSGVFLVPYYTIPKIKRELKRNLSTTRHLRYYTIPKIKRELKPIIRDMTYQIYYTIPKIKRELKPEFQSVFRFSYYTIPKIKRELKLITISKPPARDYTIPKIKRELKPPTTAR